jgi:hypothetical protein
MAIVRERAPAPEVNAVGPSEAKNIGCVKRVPHLGYSNLAFSVMMAFSTRSGLVGSGLSLSST